MKKNPPQDVQCAASGWGSSIHGEFLNSAAGDRVNDALQALRGKRREGATRICQRGTAAVEIGLCLSQKETHLFNQLSEKKRLSQHSARVGWDASVVHFTFH